MGETVKKLSECREGDRVVVRRIGGSGAFRKRLLEMGFMRGCELCIVRYAPLKDPLELVLRGFHVSLRVCEAQQVEVENAE
jgi:Fe2+ transport system protein FeoA